MTHGDHCHAARCYPSHTREKQTGRQWHVATLCQADRSINPTQHMYVKHSYAKKEGKKMQYINTQTHALPARKDRCHRDQYRGHYSATLRCPSEKPAKVRWSWNGWRNDHATLMPRWGVFFHHHYSLFSDISQNGKKEEENNGVYTKGRKLEVTDSYIINDQLASCWPWRLTRRGLTVSSSF